MDHTCIFNITEEILEKTCSASAGPLSGLRLNNIKGFEERKNDVLYWRPNTELFEKSIVVYFGGDVQDFLENMENNKEETKNHDYIEWNLENTAYLLNSHFPDKHIIVVRPSRMDFNTFSCYENFVPVIKYGSPKHRPMYHALQHLGRLLKTITAKIRELPQWKEESIPDLHKCDMTLIGFSKGCVVLNQFLYEFHYMKTLSPDDKNMLKFVSRIKDMYWLDGGHSGGKNTWITSRSLLETLASLGIDIHVHVTPYQICDRKRPWIGEEERQFSRLLREMNANIERKFHFEDEANINLTTHFELLKEFRLSHPSLGS